MIKFFRHIRKSLLIENKTSKYFKYAIGEIVLVVIGILIALSINNWNENRKLKTFEFKMLLEIKRALNNDIAFFENHLKKRAQKETEAKAFFENYLITNTINKDSINYHYYRLQNGIQVTYNKGPYEALKSTGIDKIQNDSLRNKIIDLYEFKLPRYIGLIDENLNYSSTYMQELYKKLSKKTTYTIKDSLTVILKQGIGNGINFKENSDFLNLLKLSERSLFTISMLNISINYMKKIVETIDKELAK